MKCQKRNIAFAVFNISIAAKIHTTAKGNLLLR